MYDILITVILQIDYKILSTGTENFDNFLQEKNLKKQKRKSCQKSPSPLTIDIMHKKEYNRTITSARHCLRR